MVALPRAAGRSQVIRLRELLLLAWLHLPPGAAAVYKQYLLGWACDREKKTISQLIG